jgi:hypothetical protein
METDPRSTLMFMPDGGTDMRKLPFPRSEFRHSYGPAHAHINMRGIISFHLEKAAKGLIVPQKGPIVPLETTKADS